MDERIRRFNNCDARFHVYLDQVFARLPEAVRESILSDEGFQILADAELPDVCGRLLEFDRPIAHLVYLNPKVLMQPNNRLLGSIAWEFAEYVLRREGKPGETKEVEDTLVEWGFEQEVAAVRYCDAVSKSAAFKSGYEWARKQSEDYLLSHFGLYFDEWNDKGLRMMSKEQLQSLRTKTAHSKSLPGAAAIPQEHRQAEGISGDEAAIEGIMMAVKELKLKHQ